MSEHITESEQSTKKLAAEFAKKLKGGEMVELIGELGSGKTTFVRGVVEALGSKARVKSPTFTIMNEYPVSKGKIKKVIHLDFYRFEDPSQLEALALQDYDKENTVVLMEWPDIFATAMFNPTHKIHFEFIDETTRQITL